MSKQNVFLLATACVVFVMAIGIQIRQSASVSGFVFLDGEPLTEADVFLVGNETSNSVVRSFTRTDTSGRFEVTKGLPPGEYKVIVRRLIGDSVESLLLLTADEFVIDPTQEEARTNALSDKHRSVQQEASILTPLQQLPEIYSSPEHTIIRMHLPRTDANAANIHLSLTDSNHIASNQTTSVATR
jgi:hypothetical protein